MTSTIDLQDTRGIGSLFSSLGYMPSEGQWQFHQSNARFKILVAGSRFGKSMSAARDVLPDLLRPNTRGWIVGPTYSLAEKEWRYLIDDLATLRLIKNAVKFRDSVKTGDGLISFPWGSTAEVKSADHPASLLGEELDWLIISEASQVKHSVWERYLRARLGSRQGRLILPTTPCGVNWVQDFYSRGQSPEWPDWASWSFTTLDNPTFELEEWEAAKRELDCDVFAEQYEGQFVHAQGRVYKFQDKIHTYVDSDLPRNWEDWPIIRAIDFGYTNPFACLWLALSPDAEIYVIDEIYQREKLCSDLAVDIRDRWKGHRILATVADHDAEDRATLRRHGVPTVPCIKNRLEMPGIKRQMRGFRQGLHLVKTLLKVRENGKPRLFVHRGRCPYTIEEFQNYAWPDSRAESGRDEKEEPLGKYSHAMDALRYGVCELERYLKLNVAPGMRGKRK